MEYTKQNKGLLNYLDFSKIEYIFKDNNITVGGSLDLRGTSITSLPDNLTVGGWLDLRGTNITSLPDNFTVGGSLYIRGTNITSLPDNLTVGGSLDLKGTSITSLPDNLTVGGSLYIEGTSITSLPDNLTVGGWLDLRGTNITSLPDNFTVGGSLYIRGTNITSLPDNLTVGGSLDLKGTSITSLPDNLTVGSSLDIEGTKITIEEASKVNRKFNFALDIESKLTWQNGKYRKIDGIFCEVVRKLKSCLKVKVGLETQYIVESNGVYSHGLTIKEAKKDLIYKIGNRDKSLYKGMTLETILSKSDAIKMYRVITGACRAGVKQFVENLKNTKRKYSISDVIELTKGQYGNDILEKFFNN